MNIQQGLEELKMLMAEYDSGVWSVVNIPTQLRSEQ